VPVPDPDADLSLAGLAQMVQSYAGHIEDMSDDDRLLVLGQFTGAVSRFRVRLRELYREAGASGKERLRQVAYALGEPEDWER